MKKNEKKFVDELAELSDDEVYTWIAMEALEFETELVFETFFEIRLSQLRAILLVNTMFNKPF